MVNVKCTNEECTETGIVKLGFDGALDIPIICGACNSVTEETDEEVTNANPAN